MGHTRAPLPAPPIPDEADFGSRLRSPAVAARIGVWLGICFGVAFVTGLLSHYAQQPHQPVPFPTSPRWGYQVTQAVHVISGTAAVPLLLVKLWTVYPKLFARPPRVRRELVLHGLERVSIGVLVAAAIMQLTTGVLNVAHWYAWEFNFRRTHFALAWIAIGALLVHVAVKLPVIRDALTHDVDDVRGDRPTATGDGALSRRGLLRLTWLAAAAAVVTTAAGTVPGLSHLAVLSTRERRSGDIPVNRSATSARVTGTATSAEYRCVIRYGTREAALTRDDLSMLPQHTYDLPIACVEGWSANGRWTGPRLRDVLDRVGAPRGSTVRVRSLQQRGPDRVTVLPANFADDPRTLLALLLDEEPLTLDHGFPARLIAPNRPGALQTKWVAEIEAIR